MRENIIICDDNRVEAEKTKNILVRFLKEIINNPTWEISIYNNGMDLIDDIRNEIVNPTMIFIDIELESQDFNGIHLVEIINDLVPICHIVYIAKRLVYTPDIFRTKYLYYVQKIQLQKKLPEIFVEMINKNNEYQKTIRIRTEKNRYVAINKSDIVYLERQKRRTFICGKKESWETHLTINQLEDMIQDEGIIRCHNSYMVAMKEIKSYVRTACTMSNGKVITISRKYQPIFKQKFLEWCKKQNR